MKTWYTEKLRSMRADQNMSLQELADKSGMNRGYISQVELGKRKPSFEAVETIAGALGAAIYIQLETPEAPSTASPRNKKRVSIASRFWKQ